jgi:hypothetical protein
VIVNKSNHDGRIAFPRRNNQLLKTQWLYDPPQLVYRCGGSTGIAYPFMNDKDLCAPVSRFIRLATAIRTPKTGSTHLNIELVVRSSLFSDI